MNKFLTVLCFALVATSAAKPVTNGGYTYQQAKITTPIIKQQSFRPSFGIGSSSYSNVHPLPLTTTFNGGQQEIKQSFVGSQPAASYTAAIPFTNNLAAPLLQISGGSSQQFVGSSGQQFVGSSQEFSAPQQTVIAPSQTYQTLNYQAPALAQTQSPVQYQQQVQLAPAQQTIISKDIYIHSAPEETEEIGGINPAEGLPIRKNYRIVFIKAPSQNVKLNLAALKQAQASNEEKTVIYVLSKKPDLTHIQQQLHTVQSEQKAHKPEVYFIKYKTQEEANRAQQEIQAQYDALGGSTHISDEGIAPITSVIGGNHIDVRSSGISSSLGSGLSSGSGLTTTTTTIGSNGFNNVGTNFVQSSPILGQQAQTSTVVQQSFQSSQSSAVGSGSSVSFGSSSAPSTKYLPVLKH